MIESLIAFGVLMVALLICIFFHSLLDWYRIVIKNIYVNHTQNALIFGVIVCALFAFLSYWGSVKHDVSAAAIVMVMSVRWIFYDAFLNLMRNLPWDYVDQVDDGDKDALTDRLLRKLNIHPMIIKLTILGFSIIIAMVIINTDFHGIVQSLVK